MILLVDLRKKAQDIRKEFELKFDLKGISAFLNGEVNMIRLSLSSQDDGSGDVPRPGYKARCK